MLELVKQTFIFFDPGAVMFCGTLAIKCLSVNNQPCMVTPRLIVLNSDKLHYYLFIISM